MPNPKQGAWRLACLIVAAVAIANGESIPAVLAIVGATYFAAAGVFRTD